MFLLLFQTKSLFEYATFVAGFWKKTEAIFLKYHQIIILLHTRIWGLLSSIYLLQSTYTFDAPRGKTILLDAYFMTNDYFLLIRLR